MTQFNLDQMTNAELYKLKKQINEKLGHYEMLTVTPDDITDHLADIESDLKPTDQQIREALAYVSRKFDPQDFFVAVNYAVEIIEERYAEEEA